MNEKSKTKKFTEEESIDIAQLWNEHLLEQGAKWYCSLPTINSISRLTDLPEGWEDALLILLPHLERQIWLTEFGNHLPAHALARMLEHWSLYVLLWFTRLVARPDIFFRRSRSAPVC